MTAQRSLRYVVNFLLLVFPACSILVEHFTSGILLLFSILGIYIIVFSGNRYELGSLEKWLAWSLAFYPAVYIFSYLFNNILGDSAETGLKYLEDESRMFLFLPIFLLFRGTGVSKAIFWKSVVIGSSLSGIYAIFSYFWVDPGMRVGGSYDAIAFGDISLLLAAMSIVGCHYLIKINKKYRYIVPVSFVLGITASALSGSRGAWIAIPALVLILFFYLGKNARMLTRIILVLSFCLLTIAAYHIPYTNIENRIKSAFNELDLYLEGEVVYGGITVRLLGLQAMLTIFKENPIIGVGPGNYSHKVKKLVEQKKLHEMTTMHKQPCSTLFATMSDCGLLGLIALIGVFLYPFYFAIRIINQGDKTRDLGYGLMIAAVAFGHFSASEVVFHRSMFTSFYVIMVAAITAFAINEIKCEGTAYA